MPSSLEAEIGSLLKSRGSANLVADELLARIGLGGGTVADLGTSAGRGAA